MLWTNVKALAVVLPVALVVFALARSVSLRHVSSECYARRTAVWLVLTLAVFLTPSIWLYFALATPVILWAAARDENPLALYTLLLYVAPPASVWIPAPGINLLFDLSHIRLLGLLILLPLLFQAPPAGSSRINVRFAVILIVAYCLIRVLVRVPYDPITTSFRSAFLLFLDVLLVVIVFMKHQNSHRQLLDTMTMFCVWCFIAAPLAIFEAVKFWPLYANVYNMWGIQVFGWIERGGLLRALVSAGHPLALGYLMAIGLAFWHCVRQTADNRVLVLAGYTALIIGLIAAYSRGPWLVAFAVSIAYFALMPRAFTKLTKIGTVAAVALGVISLTPYWPRIVDSLPFVGSLESENITYRQELLDTAVELIAESPWFGDPFALEKMEHLRQSQGIIDVVNGYVYVALFYGIPSIAALALAMVILICKGGALTRSLSVDRMSERAIGACLVCALIGSMIYIGTAGFEHFIWIVLGALGAYLKITGLPNSVPALSTANSASRTSVVRVR